MNERRFHIVQVVRQNPAVMQMLCLILVPVLIIFAPILIYGVFFHLEMPISYMLQHIPWWPILIMIGIAALLSLLHTPASVGIQADDHKHSRQPADGLKSEVVPETSYNGDPPRKEQEKVLS